MKIEHIAIWTHNLETLKEFYIKYFNAKSNEKYVSKNSYGFESYFLSFDGGARLELMQKPDIPQGDNKDGFNSTGLTHFAFDVHSNEKLDLLFERMKKDDVKMVSSPRLTGDGYYEACVLDPDGNRVEITVENGTF